MSNLTCGEPKISGKLSDMVIDHFYTMKHRTSSESLGAQRCWVHGTDTHGWEAATQRSELAETSELSIKACECFPSVSGVMTSDWPGDTSANLCLSNHRCFTVSSDELPSHFIQRLWSRLPDPLGPWWTCSVIHLWPSGCL